jgi:predicted O-methyltransferase YrrM
MDVHYWFGALSSLARHAKREPRFLLTLLRAGLATDARGQAQRAFIHSAYPQMKELEVDLGSIRYRPSDQDPLERFFLAALCQIKKPRTILEIGTFDGTTTRVLAQNAPNAAVLTLDLPPEDASTATFEPETRQIIAGRVGSAFAGRPEAARIQQLLGDSRTFDFSPWARKIDLVVIDGGHEYDVVSADTRTAQVVLKPDGVIVWDDYDPWWPSVIRAVDETELPVTHILNTGFAVYDPACQKGGQGASPAPS